MRSDKSFFDFLRSGTSTLKISAALLIGAILILIVFLLFPGEEKRAEGTDELTELCSEIEGVGECRVSVSYKNGGEEVYAVAIVCEGADDPYVRARLVELFSSLYGIGANRISVLKISEKN